MAKLSKKDLLLPFQRGFKAPADYQLGLELEHFVVKRSSGEHVGYSDGIEKVLTLLAAKGHWEPSREAGKIIGLSSDYGNITLEPSAAIEFSSTPKASVAEVEADVRRFYSDINQILTPLDFELSFVGFQPNESIENLELIPKGRYKVMYDYMPSVGSLGREMMKLTASAQICIDFSSESDAMRKMMLAAKLTPFFIALSANSRRAHGKDSGHASNRAFVWLDTDRNRFGYPDLVLQAEPTFDDYVEWALDVPVYFVQVNEQLFPLTHISFRTWMDEGAKLPGNSELLFPTLANWETHLGTLFPWVRLRNYLELRAFDMNEPETVGNLLRIVSEIFYSEKGLTAAEKLVGSFEKSTLDGLLHAAVNNGLLGTFAGISIADGAMELKQIARLD